MRPKNQRGWATFWVMMLAVFCGNARAEEVSSDWAMRIISAYDRLSYQGIFVYLKNGSLETMEVVHSAADGGQTRLVSLNGEVTEIHRRGDQMTRYLPQRGLFIEGLRWSNPFFASVPEDISRVAAHYTLKSGETDRVAGRECQRVEVQPRDALRYGYRLCVDRETALVLDARLIDEQGQVRQEVMFTQLLVVKQIDPALLAPGMNTSGLKRYLVKTRTHGANGADARTWDVVAPPPGYRLVFGGDHTLPDGGGEQEHLVYSDGLSAISVFIDAGPLRGKPIVGQTRRGSMNAYGDVREGHQVLVVGEVPYAALKAMVEALRRRP
ncbi:MAG: MucB/RseB C-terminal domain-containing protein [Pseudomonadota bacterium]